ncbi:uncharacterized protein STEHIDRAFT_147739 [Stereum hirsutum FP-91666 SS1]|uniref:uncharacterized protein n=1 Tax=Stereum hirsutum (strain FP-91666) TaxID=721885 RepID=UPI000444951C|nr:uncharacterized protein STEHIDRAFT_147739 [Stereum hirsutum FP-91666 SS1]EIM85192.1 hypothetical protein STEHIDRAFT_147739 [Stereum hirsutum FP-91666 SS1]
MTRAALLPVLAVVATSVVKADYFNSIDPLISKTLTWGSLPQQVDTDTADPRGTQTGYNVCNSTTENQESLCQTMVVNHIDDFCIWAPPEANTAIADSEGEEVAWCTKKGYGTRLIPEGAITGIQFVKTPSYLQIAAFVDQTLLNIPADDYGGELDSGGQDGNGNPMGGAVFSNAFPSSNGDNSTYAQANHWSFFIGGNFTCGKVCDQTGSNPQGLCQNIYDRLGCTYNAPNNAQDGVFEYCEGDDMTPVGTYVVNGATSVYTQPAETVSITDIPYTPTPAATSNCITYTSSALFTDLVGVSPTGTGASTTGSGSAAATGSSKASSGSKSATGSGATGTATGASSSGAPAALSMGWYSSGLTMVVGMALGSLLIV